MSIFRIFRRLWRKPSPGLCPRCHDMWVVIKKHPEVPGVLLYLCPRGHKYKR